MLLTSTDDQPVREIQLTLASHHQTKPDQPLKTAKNVTWLKFPASGNSGHSA